MVDLVHSVLTEREREYGEITSLTGMIYLQSILQFDNHELSPEFRGNFHDTKLLNIKYLSN